MGDDAPLPARPATALTGALLSGAAALAMAGAAHSLRPSSSDALGEDALIAWVLVAVAGLGILFCVYLAVIWGLAAVVMAAGPASRIGAALLIALRTLAPQVARRVVISTALAATATGLALAPATAADRSPGDSAEASAPVAVSSELTPSDRSDPDTEPDAEPVAGLGDPSATPAAGDQGTGPDPLPALGWGEEQGEEQGAAPSDSDGTDAEDPAPSVPQESDAPAAGDPDPGPQTSQGSEVPDLDEPGRPPEPGRSGQDQNTTDTTDTEDTEDTTDTGDSRPSPSADAAAGAPAQPASPGHESRPDPARPSPASSTVVVQSGDTLWSITDELLGPAADTPSEIAAAWPLLHDANRDVIGTDPDLLEPGQELLVPTPLSSQEQ